MGSAGRVGRSREGELNGLVDRQRVDASRWQEVLGGLRTAQNLKEDGDGWRGEGRVVDEEVRAVKVEDHIDGHISTALCSPARL